MAVFLPFLVSTRPTQTTKSKTLGFFFSNLFATSSFFGLFLCVLSKQTSFFCFCCFRKIWTLSENRKKYFKGKKNKEKTSKLYLSLTFFFLIVIYSRCIFLLLLRYLLLNVGVVTSLSFFCSGKEGRVCGRCKIFA